MENKERMVITDGELNTYKVVLAISSLFRIEKSELIERFVHDDSPQYFEELEKTTYFLFNYYDEKSHSINFRNFPIDPRIILAELNKNCEYCINILIKIKNAIRENLILEDINLCVRHKKSSRKRRNIEKQLIFVEWFLSNVYSMKYEFDKIISDPKLNFEKYNQKKYLNDFYIFSKKNTKRAIKKEWKLHCKVLHHPFLFSNKKTKHIYGLDN